MSDIAIKVQEISKAYRIGLKDQRHDTFGGMISSWLKSPFKNLQNLRNLSNFTNKEDADIFWALKNINFEVKKGDVLGIIGKNGAGKSTLLKILSRITEPTNGKIEIYGRVASLLEVGTGFNQELTGRENVYLNGTILGMTRKEIDAKFDEIVEFSGIEKFIDTPVKRYSSGMKVRLAFAVAAHLDPEILIIDEVLAVGDVEFQKKCMGKMDEVAKGGRTVLFVSHNMAAVSSLCNKGILLNAGQIIYEGTSATAVTKYLSHVGNTEINKKSWLFEDAPGDSRAKLLDIEVFPAKGDVITIGTGIIIRYICKTVLQNVALDVSFNVRNEDDVLMFHHGKILTDPSQLKPGTYQMEVTIPPFVLNSGRYSLDVWMGLQGREMVGKKVDYALSFDVADSPVDHFVKKMPGAIRPLLDYSTSLIE